MTELAPNSETFDRGLAIQCLRSHGYENSFLVNSCIEETTLDELKRLGCTVRFDQTTHKYSISSNNGFADIIKKYERREERRELMGIIGFRVIYYGSMIGLFIFVAKMKMGILTIGIWFWGSRFMLEGITETTGKRMKSILIGTLLLFLGYAAHLLGWSGEN